MATTRIMPVHAIKELGTAQTIKSVMDYVKNPKKTSDGLSITAFECDVDIAAEDFMLARDEYIFRTGRGQGENEILAYHVRQAFKPGEVDADTAAQLGFELAMELTGGDHAFIVCTHTDKPHFHNHLIINAVNVDCDKKLRNEIGSYKRVRKIADRISAENDLSVVENPALSKGTRNRYDKPTKRDGFVKLIDEILEIGQPKDFDDFLKQLEKKGCKVRRRGNTISVKPPGAERFFRFRAGSKGLSDGYDEESLRKKIVDMQAEIQKAFEKISSVTETEPTLGADAPMVEKSAEPVVKISHDKKIGLIIDIENSIKAQNSLGYQRWAEGFNLQQAAATLMFLQANNLTDMEALTCATNQAKSDYNALQARIDAADRRLKDVNALQRYIGAYDKNRDVYSQYLLTKRNPKFRAENEKAIATVEEAKAYFDSLGLESLPSINELRAEYSKLSQEKYKCYQVRNDMRQYVSDLQSAKKNAEMLLGIDGERNSRRVKDNRHGEDR